MPLALLIAAPVLALITYVYWFRRAGFSGFAMLFAFIAGPFLALFFGTTVESVTDNRGAGIVAAICCGPLVISLLTPLLERTRRDRQPAPAGMLLLYGAVIFICACLILASFSLRAS
jgi:hypothetical protein